MAKDSGKFKRCIMSKSFQEQRKKELVQYKERVIRLESMDVNEIDFEYINMKTRYEHRKNILSVFILSILISILTNAWKYFYAFLEKVIQYATAHQENGMEAAKVMFFISSIIFLLISIIIFVIVAMYMKGIHRAHKELMIIEEIRNRRNKSD